MKNTIKLLKKQHDVLVDVIQYLDSTKQSNTLIRSQVDTILNFEKKLKEDSGMELTKIKLIWKQVKQQAPSFKRHEKDTIKMYKQLRKGEIWKTQLNY